MMGRLLFLDHDLHSIESSMSEKEDHERLNNIHYSGDLLRLRPLKTTC